MLIMNIDLTHERTAIKMNPLKISKSELIKKLLKNDVSLLISDQHTQLVMSCLFFLVQSAASHRCIFQVPSSPLEVQAKRNVRC